MEQQLGGWQHVVTGAAEGVTSSARQLQRALLIGTFMAWRGAQQDASARCMRLLQRRMGRLTAHLSGSSHLIPGGTAVLMHHGWQRAHPCLFSQGHPNNCDAWLTTCHSNPTGHPNVVKLVDAYEDERQVHLVMELCTGGEMVERIVNKVRRGAPLGSTQHTPMAFSSSQPNRSEHACCMAVTVCSRHARMRVFSSVAASACSCMVVQLHAWLQTSACKPRHACAASACTCTHGAAHAPMHDGKPLHGCMGHCSVCAHVNHKPPLDPERRPCPKPYPKP